MGYCDPKAIRDGKSWADVVNKTPMKCPSCTHKKGFRCLQCWPQSRTIGSTGVLKIQGLTRDQEAHP